MECETQLRSDAELPGDSGGTILRSPGACRTTGWALPMPRPTACAAFLGNRAQTNCRSCNASTGRASRQRAWRKRSLLRVGFETMRYAVCNTVEASTGIEPAYTDLQSAASPLRHRAAPEGASLATNFAACNLSFSGNVRLSRIAPLKTHDKGHATARNKPEREPR